MTYWTELGDLRWEEEIHDLPDMTKGGQKHSPQRLPEEADFPWCSSSNLGWYMRLPADPPQVDPKVKMPLELCEEEYAFWNQLSP